MAQQKPFPVTVQSRGRQNFSKMLRQNGGYEYSWAASARFHELKCLYAGLGKPVTFHEQTNGSVLYRFPGNHSMAVCLPAHQLALADPDFQAAPCFWTYPGGEHALYNPYPRGTPYRPSHPQAPANGLRNHRPGSSRAALQPRAVNGQNSTVLRCAHHNQNEPVSVINFKEKTLTTVSPQNAAAAFRECEGDENKFPFQSSRDNAHGKHHLPQAIHPIDERFLDPIMHIFIFPGKICAVTTYVLYSCGDSQGARTFALPRHGVCIRRLGTNGAFFLHIVALL